MPPIALVIIQALPLLISAAKDAAPIIAAAKDAVSNLFNGGTISADQQNALHAHMDALQAAAIAGDVLPEFTVEADPGAAAPAPAPASGAGGSTAAEADAAAKI